MNTSSLKREDDFRNEWERCAAHFSNLTVAASSLPATQCGGCEGRIVRFVLLYFHILRFVLAHLLYYHIATQCGGFESKIVRSKVPVLPQLLHCHWEKIIFGFEILLPRTAIGKEKAYNLWDFGIGKENG